MLHCAFGYTPDCMPFKVMFMLFIFFESLGQGLIGRWLKVGDEDYMVITSGVKTEWARTNSANIQN